ncbi:MAG TPA: class II fructose-bisphosphatase [Anaeromyxobacter sp.]|nr:class II fructose-bisphosphatase [Anaeromyxobacter sp.]
MDRNMALEVVRVTEAAALASARLMGRGDRDAADQAATDAMRRALADVPVHGEIVLAEGSEEPPAFRVGEKVGKRRDGDADLEIAVYALEGRDACATGGANAISAIAMSEPGHLLRAPDVYMEKAALGPAARGAVDLRRTPTENLKRVAEAVGKYVEDLTVVILDRPRHAALIREVREAGARIKLIRDGDLAAAVSTCFPETGVDLLLGTGGAPEGVVAAAAIRCAGGEMLGRFVCRSEAERERLRAQGIRDPERLLTADEMAGGTVMFAATGVTEGDFLKGVVFTGDGARTHSVVMRAKTATIRFIDTIHHFTRSPNYGW